MTYTGKVAFNISGTTIHSTMHLQLLPLLTNNPTSLSSKKLDALSTHYRNSRQVVFDDISLVGSRTFDLTDNRLKSIKHVHNRPFGSRGDLFQASLVCDSWIVKPQSNLLEAIAPCYWHATRRSKFCGCSK